MKFANRMKAAGMPERQAEEEAAALADVMAEALKTSDLATKHDLSITEAKLEAKIAETRTEIERTKAELVRWVVSVGVLQTAIIAALIMRLIPS
ncbi:MAG: CCDC90 family protein [Candidatus Accumulibacter sp.]|nr:CCDC90 family protein [Accumulibacter sp.]